jgi:penicillin-binding protein 1C
MKTLPPLIALGFLLTLRLLGGILPFAPLDVFLGRPYSLHILDRQGQLLQILSLEDGSRREFTPLHEMPEFIADIFRASEDERFFLHFGIDPAAITRSLFLNLSEGRVVTGASTISMQLARIIRPHPPGIAGKIGEAITAIRLEALLSKKEILELWLNSIPFGHRAFGVTTAAKEFFGAELDELSLPEILLLAVIPRRPAYYNPVTAPEETADAAITLSQRIGIPVGEKAIRIAARNAASRSGGYPWPFEAPHFIQYIDKRIDPSAKANGLPLTTSLDLEKQHALERALSARISGAERYRISNGSGLMIDNRTGQILAYCGSVDFFNELSSGMIDGVQVRNQPGSTIKPFLYALALEMGMTPATILPDIPSVFGGQEIYIPQNFNRRYNGPVRLRTALASSLNIPAVYTLERVGVRNFEERLLELGFSSLQDQQNSVGLGLALGNAEVTLMELVRGFSLFPRDGLFLDLTWQWEERNRLPDNCEAVNLSVQAQNQVYPPQVAGMIRDILSDDIGRVTGFGSRSILNSPFTGMFKTGTSNQFQNIWALGATPKYTIGIWMGNYSGDTVIGAPGSSLPAAVVIEMLSLFTDNSEEFPGVQGTHRVKICPLSGQRATEACFSSLWEIFPIGSEPGNCTYHRYPGGPVHYPQEFQGWADQQMYYHQQNETAGDGQQRANAPEITHPSRDAFFYFDPTIPAEDQAVRVEALSHPGDTIRLRVNGALMAEGTSPLQFLLPIVHGTYTVEAEGDGGSSTIQFQVQ